MQVNLASKNGKKNGHTQCMFKYTQELDHIQNSTNMYQHVMNTLIHDL